MINVNTDGETKSPLKVVNAIENKAISVKSNMHTQKIFITSSPQHRY